MRPTAVEIDLMGGARKILRLLWLGGLVFAPSLAMAEDVLDSGDTAWMLTSSALVLLMTLPGLALFYGGLVRSRNVLSILMQCLLSAGMMGVLWILAGYSLAFSGDGDYIGNLDKFGLAGITPDTLSGTIPEYVFVVFQGMFAIITPALMIGAFAERMRFGPYLLFITLWLFIVYVPLAHMVWGGGFISGLGAIDFAGGLVVHMSSGFSALVACLFLGPRRGFGKEAMPPNSLPYTMIGASLLWVGWFGFNAGSALASNGAAGMAMLVTHIGASAGSLAWMTSEWIKFGKPSVLGIVTGMVAGLGTITPASGFVGPGGGLIIGLVAGFACFWATQTVKRKFEIDDSLDVFPVHGVGGFIGLLLTAVFAASLGGQGLPEGATVVSQLAVQLTGAVATIVWCGVITLVLLKIIDAILGLRVTEEEETEGLDLTLHDERGYNL